MARASGGGSDGDKLRRAAERLAQAQRRLARALQREARTVADERPEVQKLKKDEIRLRDRLHWTRIGQDRKSRAIANHQTIVDRKRRQLEALRRREQVDAGRLAVVQRQIAEQVAAALAEVKSRVPPPPPKPEDGPAADPSPGTGA